MKSKNKYISFIIYFSIIYTILSILFLKTIAQPLINLWEFVIRNIFGNFLNYDPFIFVPICSGVISIAVYLSILIAGKISFFKNSDFKRILLGVIFIWFVNLLRLVIVIMSEKVSISFAKMIHVLSWFVVGAIILLLSLKTFKNK